MRNALNLFFDLDGTLSDPKEGITKSIQYALGKMGRPVPDAESLAHLIGPPLHFYFTETLGADKTEEAMAHYRDRYVTQERGKIENVLYPAIPSVLTCLKDAGKKLFVVTAKPRVVAADIVRHFGLEPFFGGVYGPELRQALQGKAELIEAALNNEGLNAEETIMIGDRQHDIHAAKAHNVRSIGALWGYGSADELRTAGATALAHRPEDILDLVL